MKRIIRIIVLCLLFALFVTTAIVMLVYSAKKQRQMVCVKSEITIERENHEVYLQKRDIEKWLKEHGIGIIGKKSEMLNTSNIEQVLAQNPYVGFAQVFMTQDGICHLQLEQRNPMLKVVCNNGKMYQIDRKGVEMPLNTDYAVRLRVANGYIPVLPKYGANVTKTADTSQRAVLKRLYEINAFLEADPLWDAMFEQIFVTYVGEYELIPKVGGQLVKLGKVENTADLADKMKRLELFYHKGMNAFGWDKYSVLNLKYKNQLVATKR